MNTLFRLSSNEYGVDWAMQGYYMQGHNLMHSYKIERYM